MSELACAHCHERKGTVSYYGDTTAMGWIHSHPALWCEYCVVTEQLAYARTRAAEIPGLEQRLNELRGQPL